MTINTRSEVADSITSVLESTRSEFDAKLADIQSRFGLAKGTQELAPVAPSDAALPLVERLVRLLRESPCDVLAAAQKLEVAGGRVKTAVNKLAAEGKVHNIGSAVEPRWAAVIGDDGPIDELRAAVLRLISFRPCTHRELCAFTGARDNRISACLTKLKQDSASNPERRVVNLGDGARGRWLVIPMSAQSGARQR